MFYFREFSVCDDNSSMKIGTDSCLLGAATKAEKANRILDIGTGCGILSLMLAQKSNAYIDAIDIDIESCNEAKLNFNRSKWGKRISIYCIDFIYFSKKSNVKYDVIISNPPFFKPAIKIENTKRHNARYTSKLDFKSLCSLSYSLMKEKAIFSTIVPYNRLSDFIKSAESSKLFVSNMLLIHSVANKRPKRYIVELAKQKKDNINFQRLTIRNTDGSYMGEYIKFMKDFQKFDRMHI